MSERLTEQAKRAVEASEEAALALGHDHIGTEHLLLGLAGTAGTAGDLLREHGIEPGRAREETIRLLTGKGIPATGGRSAGDALSSIGIDVAEIRRRADDSFGPGAFRFPGRPSPHAPQPSSNGRCGRRRFSGTGTSTPGTCCSASSPNTKGPRSRSWACWGCRPPRCTKSSALASPGKPRSRRTRTPTRTAPPVR